MRDEIRPELASFEGLRIVASLVIVIFHYSFFVEKRDLFHGYLAVDLFFVLSGYVIAYAYSRRVGDPREYVAFLRKRFARLYPLHALALSFYVLVGLAARFKGLHVASPVKYRFTLLPANALLVHAWGFASDLSFNIVSWSISAEVGAYLLFPLILLVMRRPRLASISALGLLYIGAIWMAEHQIGAPLPTLSWNFGVLRALPSFSLGVWLFMHRIWLAAKVAPSVARYGGYLAFLIWIVGMGLSWNDYVVFAAASLVIVFASIAEEHQVQTILSRPFFESQGKYTYSLYMIHPLVATVFISGVGGRLFGTSTRGILLNVSVAFIIAYLLSRFSYHYFEQPARKWLSGSGLRSHRLAASDAAIGDGTFSPFQGSDTKAVVPSSAAD